MTTRQLKSATRADAALLNELEPPIRGVHVGGGLHVEIPEDWAERIAAGEDVPGCTYARIQADGSLLVSDSVQAELAKQGKDETGIRARLVTVEAVAIEETIRGKA